MGYKEYNIDFVCPTCGGDELIEVVIETNVVDVVRTVHERPHYGRSEDFPWDDNYIITCRGCYEKLMTNIHCITIDWLKENNMLTSCERK